MQITITQRYPERISNTIQPPQVINCTTTESVYYVPFVQGWVTDPTFTRLCKCTLDHDPNHLLVVETTGGKYSWVIGYIRGEIEQLNLPEWR